jgi:hypothetical protein
LAQEGSPPRNSSRQPDLGRRGYDRTPRPARAGRTDRADRPAGWDRFDAFGPDSDTELPPWAGPVDLPARPSRTGIRLRPSGPAADRSQHVDETAGPLPGGDGTSRRGRLSGGRLSGRRAAAARLRRSRRRVVRWAGLAIGVCVIAAVSTAIALHHSTPKLPYVTALQKGEFKSVPDSCSAVSPTVLNQYLPSGNRKQSQQFSGPGGSQCTFTFDKAPLFLVLEVQAQAYQPFPAASGDGSASQNALDNLTAVRGALASPPKGSPLPPATISPLTGLGSKAFLAVQHEHVAGIATDVVHVVVLLRNVVINISVQGQESGHGFGPVPDGTLQSAAQAAASSVLASVRTQPTA